MEQRKIGELFKRKRTMKNLFKSIMTVAVAAMAFASCSNNYTEEVSFGEKVQFTVNAVNDEITRSTFGEPADGKYPTLWEGNEKFVINVNGEGNKQTTSDVTAKFSEDKRGAYLTVAFTELAAQSDYTLHAMVPASACVFNSITADKGWQVTIPTAQTPKANSCDAAAQILIGVSETKESPAESFDMTFKHAVAYGKMSLKNLNLGDATISSVAITSTKNIADRFYINHKTGAYSDNSGATSITINTTSTENIWFALAPVDVSGTELSIVVNTNKGTFTKKVTMPTNSVFEAGKVSTFKVDMDGVKLEGPVKYELLTNVADLTAGTYYMAGYATKYTSNGETTDYSTNPYHMWTGKTSTSSGNTDLETAMYSYTDGVLAPGSGVVAQAAVVTLEAVDGKANTYYVNVGGQYLGNTESGKNRRLTLSETKVEWVASDFADGGIILSADAVNVGTAKAKTNLIRSYKDDTYNTSLQYGLVFFTTDGTPNPDPTPDPEPEPTPDPEPTDITTIAEVLALGNDAAINAVIEGVVISNMELNNLTSKKGMYVQDATGGLQFYLAANHEFAFGTKVQIDLTGATLGAYNGAVQISGLALDKITKVSEGNTVEPKTVTMADFLANKYEGQYVAIEGVQVADSDLTKTWSTSSAHTSINMVDADGNKFVVFSSKYATYGAQDVAQGSGTIKGISAINNGTMQIIFAQKSDFAGLTGARFGISIIPAQTAISIAADELYTQVALTLNNITEEVTVDWDTTLDWIYDASVECDKLREKGTLFISVGKNERPESRTATFTLTANGAVATVTLTQSGAISGDAEIVTATLSFADIANRTHIATTQQVWEQNGIKLINDKGSSTTNIGDYYNPARFYKSTKVTIQVPENGKIQSIAIDCKGMEEKYVTPWGGTVVDGIVTISLDGSSYYYTYSSMSAQARANSITVTYAK